jgi:hypothetical protein
VVGLQHQEIIGSLRPDTLGNPLLAAHRIERDEAAFAAKGIEQLGNSGDLVRLTITLALTEDEPLLAGPSAD